MNKQLTDEILIKLVSDKKAKLAIFLQRLFAAGKEGEVVSHKECQSLTLFSAQKTYRMMGDSIFSQVSTPNSIELGGQNLKKNKGRPEKCVKVPTLDELEKRLGCVDKRRNEIKIKSVDDIKAQVELKAKVAAVGVYHTKAKSGREFGLRENVKYGQFSNKYLINKSGMSRSTWRKYSKMSMRTDPVFETKTTSIAAIANLPEEVEKHNSHFKVGEDKYPYNKSGAINAIKKAGCVEGVSVVTQLSSRRVLIVDMDEGAINAVDCWRQYGGAISLDEYMRLHAGCFGMPFEHREHYMLIKGMEGADEILHQRELEEQRQILKEASYRRL
jgi:hypothetical protein